MYKRRNHSEVIYLNLFKKTTTCVVAKPLVYITGKNLFALIYITGVVALILIYMSGIPLILIPTRAEQILNTTKSVNFNQILSNIK